MELLLKEKPRAKLVSAVILFSPGEAVKCSVDLLHKLVAAAVAKIII